MQTLRKKTSPLKYKNETTRFLGDGVSFKAKLIGILEVSEARGDRMCQEALSDLKMAIRAAGEHKQRITVNIAIDGLRLRDEKTGDSLYHHPVHKISFIAQDMADSRAFGYIFGSPDTGHRFFGIKTDKAASQVVIAMRDLFQVVFALKKKEIELAKQHLDKNRFNHSPLFSDGSNTSMKNLNQEIAKHSASDGKSGTTSSDSKSGGTAVADLVDLELELNSLQQGLHQMERITPSDPFASKDDPFGDSFITYPQKPILPPPPSSGRERSTRISESSSISSPKTPHTASCKDTSVESNLYSDKNRKTDFSFSNTLDSTQEASSDWFNTPPGNSIFEDTSIEPEQSKDEKHEITKKEILSQFDVFTELDPLGTGRSKPYIDKKHFFQELKNPPKKVLNDLVSQDPCKSFNNTSIKQSTVTDTVIAQSSLTSVASLDSSFTTDPFGEDPFVKEDPFATEDFIKQDPFTTEFKMKDTKSEEPSKENLSFIYQSSLLKSPKLSSKTVQFNNKFDDVINKKMPQENLSLDMSSESECAPEPPPRPTVALLKIKPPPLPPKKHDLIKPLPPLPPHTESPHYDFLDNCENSLSYFNKNVDKPPSLPMPARKSKFESALTSVPDRQKKQFSFQESKDDDYLTPVELPVSKNTEYILLPPPQKNVKSQQHQQEVQVTVASLLESQPNIVTSKVENPNNEINGLEISLSQLTLTDLNELAVKLNIPASQLSNMTLVQLTSYLSNIIKNKSPTNNTQTDIKSDGSVFNADFDSNFGSTNSYDRYAVFRELIQEEIKQTKIDNEPTIDEEENLENDNTSDSIPQNSNSSSTDRYAALREIAETELNKNIVDQSEDNNKNESEKESNTQEKEETTDINEDVQNTNMINYERKVQSENKDSEILSTNDNFIEYATSLDNQKDVSISLKSPRSPVNNKIIPVKSPVPTAITEIMQSNTRLTSGSLSDVISGSSPEVDNTASNSEAVQKSNDAAGESWAIFDQENVPPVKEKQVQSEEGVSPWSSDSKEFGNTSPPEWRQRVDSGSGGDQWLPRRGRQEPEGWWDTSAEPVAETYPNHRSFDSYEEEYYESYDRPRRRKQSGRGSQATGGHSSSSRDVSPWEEEPRTRDLREIRESRANWARHSRPTFERGPENRPTDSDLDDEDEYEYEDEQSGRFSWSDRYGPRDFERHSTCANREHSDRWADGDWPEDRRHRRRRDERDRWCCSDWEQVEHEIPANRFGSSRRPPPDSILAKRRERSHEDRPADRYYSRESQESPWEDDYSNDLDDSHSLHYMANRRNWKRPSSASEMDRKTGEIKSKYYFGSGGSDGERERRYKGSRRSRSKDSQFLEPTYRHKAEGSFPVRNPHSRSKQHLKSQFDNNFPSVSSKKQVDPKLDVSKKMSALTTKKKSKDTYKPEEGLHGSLPRKPNRTKLFFENDFIGANEDNIPSSRGTKFSFENDFETPVAGTTPTLPKSHKYVKHKVPEQVHFPLRQPRSFKETKSKSLFQSTSKSLFEDDFSPSEKEPEDSISSIKEEVDQVQNENSFGTNSFENTTNTRRKILNKNRLSGGMRADFNIIKSESVNIFKREEDPFDDDFFCEESSNVHIGNFKESTKDTELKWTENFDDFDTKERK